MFEFFLRFRPFFAYAALFSLFINLLLLVPTIYMLQVFDRVITSRSVETLALLTLASVLGLATMTLLEGIRARLLTSAGIALDSVLGPKVLERILAATPDSSRGEAGYGLRDAGLLRSFLTGPGILSLFDAPWMPLYVLLIFLFHPLLGLIAALGAAALVTIAVVNERMTRKSLQALQTASRRAGRYIDASLRNSEVIRALGMAQGITAHWQRLNGEVQRQQVENNRTGGSLRELTKFGRQFLQTAMMAAGAYLVIHQDSTAGVMIATTLIFGRAMAPVEAIVVGWKGLVDAHGAYRRLDTQLKNQQGSLVPTELPEPLGQLALERVAFGLGEPPRAIIKGVSLSLAAGEALGIIGPSASGKSTLARLIIGLMKPQSGAVRLDGADISAWPRERVGPFIGYLPQDVELFAGTVAANIARLGDIDDDAVVAAAQRAGAHEMILRLPQGYDTQIGDDGAAISGGQRQRIALARALYGSPRLVVLDEPNANLDSEGELALIQALARLKGDGVTVVVISHRPLILGSVDKILVLRDGVAEALGPRQEIVAKLARSLPGPAGAAA
ncbi:type I secretion system permease/ATPase [Sulfurisoma sediminicola]|uniref:ATP-binding cassette subfamily C exporter for protease/lipase/ATP-binding cassette subfamily C protein EexD n=1 Tax=Sulfurisoma sediminicola TaxID=1381557 RepID=A0A497XJT7_9PROT|nr:type I secretion system permease/ATPase [Sulfurisoma sediminicola]RLJ67620.1 ATP-binding cassette subfamily C exporter for protease/lipase/ATP-binding cassette subfamily C protein EexD [Sulfurisoma sediminicola]